MAGRSTGLVMDLCTDLSDDSGNRLPIASICHSDPDGAG